MSIIICAVVVAAAIALVFFALVNLLGKRTTQEVHWFSNDTHKGEELQDGVVRLFHQGYQIHLIIPIEFQAKPGKAGQVDGSIVTKAVIITTKQR